MSYDVSIKVKVEGLDHYVFVYDLGNITWNVRELIRQSSGWDIKNEAPNGPLQPWLEKIRAGIKELEQHPGKYRQYEARNGWGTVEGTLEFYRHCVHNAEKFLKRRKQLLPAAVVYVD